MIGGIRICLLEDLPPIRLFQKVTITFKGNAHHTTLKLDNLIEYMHASGTSMGQIKCIFTHNRGDRWNIFFAMLFAQEIRWDRVLDLPVL